MLILIERYNKTKGVLKLDEVGSKEMQTSQDAHSECCLILKMAMKPSSAK